MTTAVVLLLCAACWVWMALYYRRGRIIRHQANEILVLGAELDNLDEQVEMNRAAYDWEEDGSW